MIRITYTIPSERKAVELEWLDAIGVYPGIKDVIKDGKLLSKIGVIVNPDIALMIKLRHKLDLQEDYRQR